MYEIFEEFIKKQIPITLDVGVVTKVEENTCTIQSLTTNKDFFKCRLNAIEKNEGDYLKLTPKINSTVVFGVFKETEKAIVIATSQVEKLEYKVGSTFYKVDENGFEIISQETNLKEVLKKGLENQNEVNEVLQKVVVAIGTSPDVPKLIEIKESTDATIVNLLKILK